MKASNGMGSVYRLSGNRRKPYVAMVTVKTIYDAEKDNYKMQRKALGYFRTQQEARKCLADYNETKCDAELYGLTFDEIWKKILPELEKTLSAKRIATYKCTYKHFDTIKNMKIKDIRTQHLQSVIDACTKKSSTKDIIKAISNKVFDYAMKNDLVLKNYTDFISYKTDDSEIQRVLFENTYVSGLLSAPFSHYEAITVILCYTGLRVRELLLNTVDNFDMENRMLYVPESLAKNKSSIRYVPIHEDIVPLLEQFISFGNKYIIARTPRTKIGYQSYYEYLKEMGHTPHDTRHTFITRARKCGFDSLVLKKIAGHSSKDITEKVYTHIQFEELKAEMSKLNFNGE